MLIRQSHNKLSRPLQTKLSTQLGSWGGRNHIFRLRSYSKVFESWPVAVFQL